MPTDRTPNSAVLTARLAPMAAILAVAVGVLVLVGWAFDIAVLKSVLPGWVAMKANTAVCFILIGIALWFTARPSIAIADFGKTTSKSEIESLRIPERSGRSFDETTSHSTKLPKPQQVAGYSYGNRTAYPLRVHSAFRIGLARFCSLLVGLIGLLTLGEYISSWNPGIDQWLFLEPNGIVGTSYPGRMAPEAALSFVLLACALWIAGKTRKTRWTVLAAVNFGLLVTALALAAMLSYLTPGLGSYGWFGLTIMAMHTALLFTMLGIAVMAMSWQHEVMPWSLGRGTTAAFVCGMAVLVFVGLSINRSQFWLDETNRKITSSEDVLNDIVKIQIELTEAQAHTRGYAITGDKGFMDAYSGDISVYHTKMDALRLRIAGNPEQQQQLSLIETNVDLLQRWTQQFIDASRTGKRTTRRKIDAHGDEFLDSIHNTFDQIEDEHLRLIMELKQKSESVERFSYIAITTGTLASLMIFLIVILRLNTTVNERKQAEESLRKLSQVVEQSISSIVITDLDANIEYVNATFIKTTGYSMAELVGQNPRLLHSDKTPDETYTDMWAHLTRGETWKGEFINRCKDGGEIIEEALVSPMRQPDGRVTHYMAIKKDITQFKQAQALLVEQLDELRRWHDTTSSREGRILDLKHEVNELLTQAGQPPRYPSAESQIQTEK